MSQSWWQRRSGSEKIILVVFPILVICLIVGVTLGIVLKNRGKNNTDTDHKWKDASKLLTESMDKSVDPCQDFYKFTCGNWESSYYNYETIDKFSLLQVDVYTKLKNALDKMLYARNLPSAESKLIDVYRSCLDFYQLDNDDIRELQDLLNSVGGWPMSDANWKEEKYDIDISIAKAIRTLGIAALVEFGVLPDDKNTSRNIIILQPPAITQTGFNNPDIENLLESMATKLSSSFINPFNFKSDMKNVITMEENLRDIISNTLNESPDVNNRVIKIKDLPKEIPGVDFVQFFQEITNMSLHDINEFLTGDDEIVMKNIAYFKGLSNLIQSNKFPLRTYANYIGANIILQTFMLASAVVHRPGYEPRYQWIIYSKAPSTWIPCLQILTSRLNYVSDRVFVDYLGITKADKKANEIIDRLHAAFVTLANEADWLDESTLAAVKEKSDAIAKFVGYAPWIKDDQKLENYYKTLPEMGKYFFPNLRQISEFAMQKMLRKLREVNNLNEWPDLPQLTTTMVNAFYILPYNSINFPLAIQNPPFYFPGDQPWYMNFGAIGAIIGHEITHGFDSQGSQRDKNGNMHNWWSETAKEQFKKKAQCFIEKYNAYYDSQTSRNINGTLTLPENIADNGGLRQAFLAYQNWEKEHGKESSLPGLEKYTPHQLLFISYGNMWCAKYGDDVLRAWLKQDGHTPSPYRVWGAISNSKEFADTFNCPSGAPMNPKEKCIIW